jgi:hypothetical protein
MIDGRILIASDEAVWQIVQRWAQDPDAFHPQQDRGLCAGRCRQSAHAR